MLASVLVRKGSSPWADVGIVQAALHHNKGRAHPSTLISAHSIGKCWGASASAAGLARRPKRCKASICVKRLARLGGWGMAPYTQSQNPVEGGQAA